MYIGKILGVLHSMWSQTISACGSSQT